MNGDPYARTSQSSDRRVINRGGATPARSAEEPSALRDEPPQNATRSSAGRRNAVENDEKKRGSKKGLWWTLVIIVVLVLVAVAGWFVWSNTKNIGAAIDESKYQAVFLANGQIYFGKLQSYNNEYFRLTTGYSAQATTSDTDQTDQEETTTPNSDVQLIRLGDEVYGPENEIFITKEQVLHFENLKKDSKVTHLIDQNEASRR